MCLGMGLYFYHCELGDSSSDLKVLVFLNLWKCDYDTKKKKKKAVLTSI